MAYEYGEKRLYNQLLYFASLWDVERAKREVGGGKGGGEGREARERRERVEALAEWNRERFGTLAGVVDAYLRKCGRRAVAMDGLFAFMLNR